MFVAFPTAAQLDLISETEGNYEVTAIERISCRLETGSVLGEASAYLSGHGCLLLDGSVVALAAVRSRGRLFPELSQRQVLERIRDHLRPGQALEDFIVDCVAGEVPRQGALPHSP